MQRNQFILFAVLFYASAASAQSAPKRAFGVSFPIIAIRTEVQYSRLGNPKYSSATALSYGLDLHYRRDFRSGLWGGLSAGLFKQRFNNQRPFNFAYDTSLLLLSTDRYLYDNVKLSLTAGYRHQIKEYTLRESVTYNYLYSFRQKYVPNVHTSLSYRDFQVEHKNYAFGQTVTVNCAASKFISKEFTIELGLIIPIYTQWRKDAIFWEDPSEHYHSKYGLGISVSVNHNF